MKLTFNGRSETTLGLELEIQLIEPGSGKLISLAPQLIQALNSPRFKPELFQCILEINTEVCHSFWELKNDIESKLQILKESISEFQADVLLAGTHPFSHWRNQKITENERYLQLVNQIQWPLRRFLIFGLHLHVGVSDGDRAIYLMNQLSNYIPHMVALSASSPYWISYDTGLASIRTTVFDALPRAGIPQFFETWKGYEAFVDKLLKCHSIHSFRDVWWDIRPHPEFGTVEIRACDIAPTLKENLALCAFIFSLTKKLEEDYQSGIAQFPPDRWLLLENKWRASRYGLEAELLSPNSDLVIPIRELILATYEALEPVARAHECLPWLKTIPEIMEIGPSYVRQRHWVNAQKCNFSQVVKKLNQEFKEDTFLI